MAGAKPAAARCKSVSPSFAVPDVVVAAEYYRDKLGFQILGYFLDPPIYAIVRRDSVEIHLGRIEGNGPSSPNAARREGRIDAYVWVDDVDTLNDEFRKRGARIAEPPEKRVYQCYEMVVEDNSGFRIAFGMNIAEG
jgi:hypothetical protein